jgi:hypothetical protein
VVAVEPAFWIKKVEVLLPKLFFTIGKRIVVEAEAPSMPWYWPPARPPGVPRPPTWRLPTFTIALIGESDDTTAEPWKPLGMPTKSVGRKVCDAPGAIGPADAI